MIDTAAQCMMEAQYKKWQFDEKKGCVDIITQVMHVVHKVTHIIKLRGNLIGTRTCIVSFCKAP
jgi:hypothetical protein